MTGAQVQARCCPARSATPAVGPRRPQAARFERRDGDGAARFQAQAAQAPGRFGAEVQRAMPGHGPAVGRVHGDVVRSGAPDVGHFPVGGRRQERAPAGPQHDLAHRRIGVQPQLGPAEQAHAQVEHLERQAVAAGVVVLLHVAAALQDGEQAVDRRGGLAELTPELADRQAARGPAQRLADLEGLVDGGRHGRLRLSLPPTTRSIPRNDVPVPHGPLYRPAGGGTRTRTSRSLRTPCERGP